MSVILPDPGSPNTCIKMLRNTSNGCMGFLDNLEDSLKSLESQEERDPNVAQRREDDRARVLAAAPWAEQLKTSPYTRDLFDKAAAAGHRIRAKVYMSWLETTLRLEAKGRILELRPTSEGIVSEYTDAAGERKIEPVDLNADPDDLLQQWLSSQVYLEGEQTTK